jgi:hypothetical protein
VVLAGLIAEIASAHSVECPNGCVKQPAVAEATHVENDKHPLLVKEPPSAAYTASMSNSMGSLGQLLISPDFLTVLNEMATAKKDEQQEGPGDTGAS